MSGAVSARAAGFATIVIADQMIQLGPDAVEQRISAQVVIVK